METGTREGEAKAFRASPPLGGNTDSTTTLNIREVSVAKWLRQLATVLGVVGSNPVDALVIQRFISQTSIQTFTG